MAQKRLEVSGVPICVYFINFYLHFLFYCIIVCTPCWLHIIALWLYMCKNIFFHFFVFKYLYFFLQYKISISSMPIAHTVTPNYKQHIEGFFGEQKKYKNSNTTKLHHLSRLKLPSKIHLHGQWYIPSTSKRKKIQGNETEKQKKY